MAKTRLQKVIAERGMASRRKAEELIRRGEVVVNGRVARIGESADPDVDVIEIGGTSISDAAATVYLALYKPTGYVTSTRKIGSDPTVMQLVNADTRIFPAGRLDRDTSGLVLLTSDGDWANLVTHPRHMTEKEYRVLVRGQVLQSSLHKMRNGVDLPGGTKTAPAQVKEVRPSGAGNTRLSLTLIEGKKRQIREMCEVLGHPVLSLERVRVGQIRLGDLKPGEWRLLSREEIEGIRDQEERPAEG